jgi:hypothetical protein
MKRRALDFRSEDEVVAELDRLQKGGYEKGGNWSLGQICNHAAIFVRGSLDGFTGPKSPWWLGLIAPMLVRRMIKHRRMPEGVKLPPHLLPAEGVDEGKEVEELKRLLLRFRDHQGPLHPSPFSGEMDRESWRQLHLVHCAHHLSFLHPKSGA